MAPRTSSTATFRPRLSDVLTQIADRPIKIVYDAYAEPETQNAVYDLLSPGGSLLLVRFTAIDKAKLTEEKFATHVWGDVQPPQYLEVGRDLYQHLPEMLAAGQIKGSER